MYVYNVPRRASTPDTTYANTWWLGINEMLAYSGAPIPASETCRPSPGLRLPLCSSAIRFLTTCSRGSVPPSGTLTVLTSQVSGRAWWYTCVSIHESKWNPSVRGAIPSWWTTLINVKLSKGISAVQPSLLARACMHATVAVPFKHHATVVLASPTSFNSIFCLIFEARMTGTTDG